MMDFALKMMDFALKITNFVFQGPAAQRVVRYGAVFFGPF